MKMEMLPVFMQVVVRACQHLVSKIHDGADVRIVYDEERLEVHTRKSVIALEKKNGTRIVFLKLDKQGRVVFKKVGQTPVDVFEETKKIMLRTIMLEREPDEEIVEYVKNKIESA